MIIAKNERKRPKRGTASERVLIAASRLLIDNRGHLEISELAQAAGCSTGAIYHNFGSKTGVLTAVIERYNAKVEAIMLPEAVEEGREPWLISLRDTVYATIAFMWTDPMTSVIVQEVIGDSGAALETERWLRVHVERLTTFFVASQSKGHIPTDRDAEAIAAGIAGGLRQMVRMFMSRNERPSVDYAAREAWQFIARQLDR